MQRTVLMALLLTAASLPGQMSPDSARHRSPQTTAAAAAPAALRIAGADSGCGPTASTEV